MSKIIIVDGQTNEILDHIRKNDVVDNVHERNMSNWVETFKLTVLASKRYAQYLLDRNRLIIPDEDGTYRELVIKNTDRYSDSSGVKYIDIVSLAFYQDLDGVKEIKPGTTVSQTAEAHAREILLGTEVKVGEVAYTDIRTIKRENYTDPFSALKSLANEFHLELNFRIEIDRGTIIRYADLVERIGEWHGRTIEFGKDLQTIRRKTDANNIVTALRVLGPEQENGERLEILVEDEEARNRWGRNGEHIIKPFEPQSENQDMTIERLTQLGRTELNKRINSLVTWEISITDLEHVPGMQNKKIRYGDTIYVKDTGFNPPFFVTARIFKQRRNIFYPGSKQVELGDFREFTVEQVRNVWKSLQDEIQKKLERLVLASITSSAGSVFKNGIGSTELEAKTFLGGKEVDGGGTKYEYRWYKFDKNGELIYSSREFGKKINVTASSIDEKASYTVEIILNDEVLTLSQITLSNIFDGAKGEKGDPGIPGVPGPPGENGQALYTWVKYATDDKGSNMSDLPTRRSYIGFAYNKTTKNESTNPSDYEWAKIEGDQGTKGADGKTYYTWLKYADTPTSGMSDSPEGKLYMGLAYNKTSPNESTNYADYSWSLIKGDKGDRGLQGIQGPRGDQGIPGEKGADGRTSYTHIAYADTANGGGFSQNPANKAYIGMYVDHTPTDSTDPSKYKWSLIKGADGENGVPGPPGEDGRTPYFHTAWANNSTGTSGFSTTISENKLYIGTYTDFIQADSTNPAMYSWTKIKGDKGDKGDTGDRGASGPKGDKGDKGDDGKTNLVSNPAVTGNHAGWTGGSVTSVNDTFEGVATRVLRNTSTTNATTYSDWFDYDPSKAYEISLWVRKSAARGRYYVGLHAGTSDSNSLPFVQVNDSNGTIVSASTTNFYFRTSGTNTGYIKLVGYIFPSGTNAADMQRIGTNVTSNAIADPRTTRMRVRWLNYENGGTTTYMYIGQPKFTEVNPDSILESAKAKRDADNAQQSADGKTTVFRQPTQPSTSNRKKGDLWFKTNEGNKMFNWTGSAWDETPLDYQALAVEKLCAISADLGDITAGNITGVNIETTGPNGKISIYDDTVQSSLGNDEAILSSGMVTARQLTGNAHQRDAKLKHGSLSFYDPSTGTVVYDKNGVVIDTTGINGFGIRTNPGYGLFGSRNDNYFHMDTDNTGFYMYKPLTVNGNLTLTGSNVVSQKAFGVLNLQNGWENYGGSFALARYVRQADDMVYLIGVIRRGSTGTTVATLPVGSRPLETNIFAAGESPNGYGRIYVYADGRIVVSQGGSGFISLSGISFKVGN